MKKGHFETRRRVALSRFAPPSPPIQTDGKINAPALVWVNPEAQVIGAVGERQQLHLFFAANLRDKAFILRFLDPSVLYLVKPVGGRV
jgi:hypothetical protein